MLQPDLGDDAIRAAAVSEELRGTSGLIKMLEESIHRYVMPWQRHHVCETMGLSPPVALTLMHRAYERLYLTTRDTLAYEHGSAELPA